MDDSNATEKPKEKKKRKPKKSQALVDPIAVEKLASIGMTLKEIADSLNTSWSTLHRHSHLYEAWKQGRENLKMGIRKTIVHKAMVEKHWPAMRYLGDTFLGWGDPTTIDDLRDAIDELQAPKDEPSKTFVATLGPIIDVNPEPGSGTEQAKENSDESKS